VFVRAAALAQGSVDARFVLIGAEGEPGPYTRELRRLVTDLGLDDRFEFRGRLPTPEAAVAEIDVLVHVADSESFGRVVVEAMAGGRPIVGVRGGGVGELVDDGDTGLLAPVGDAAAVADRIVELVGSPELRDRLGRRGRAVAQERYTAQAMTSAMLDLYERAEGRPA
jgi:glycosyltransferase involved in cell wall biosynthesis